MFMKVAFRNITRMCNLSGNHEKTVLSLLHLVFDSSSPRRANKREREIRSVVNIWPQGFVFMMNTKTEKEGKKMG